jgi:hypothetical protein
MRRFPPQVVPVALEDRLGLGLLQGANSTQDRRRGHAVADGGDLGQGGNDRAAFVIQRLQALVEPRCSGPQVLRPGPCWTDTLQELLHLACEGSWVESVGANDHLSVSSSPDVASPGPLKRSVTLDAGDRLPGGVDMSVQGRTTSPAAGKTPAGRGEVAVDDSGRSWTTSCAIRGSRALRPGSPTSDLRRQLQTRFAPAELVTQADLRARLEARSGSVGHPTLADLRRGGRHLTRLQGSAPEDRLRARAGLADSALRGRGHWAGAFQRAEGLGSGRLPGLGVGPLSSARR